MKHARDQVMKAVNEFVGNYFKQEDVTGATRVQQNDRFSDIAVEVSELERELGYPEREFAADFVKGNPQMGEDFARVEVDRNFINFHLDRTRLVQRTLQSVLAEGEKYGCCNLGEGKLVVLDYSAPNIGKPLHVGHIRSTILGDSLVRLLQFTGFQTHGINYLGDVGLHIGKILHAFKEKGSLERLQENPEKELLELYVGFCKEEENDPALTQQAQRQVQLVERDDLETMKLLGVITQYSLQAFERVYNLLSVSIDETTGQSHFSLKGKEIVLEGERKGVIERKADGALIARLDQFHLPDKVVLRSDGTAIYSTQDIGAAVSRYEEHQFDRMLYVVGQAQGDYFKQLFTILKMLGHTWAERCDHVGFGLINLQEGKMSTREGVVVYLEELLQKAVARAREIIEEKNPDLQRKEEAARAIGVGAIKYQVLSVDKIKDIQFSWDTALNFDGKSAPYIQYTYARANSILKKAGVEEARSFNPEHLLGDEEYKLVRRMALFPLAVESSVLPLFPERFPKKKNRAEERKNGSPQPEIIAAYAYELAKEFNGLYNGVRILDDKEKLESRLALIAAYKTVLGNAMGLLGITLPGEM